MAIKYNTGKVRVTCPNGHVISTAISDEWEYCSQHEQTTDCRMGNKTEHLFKMDDILCPSCKDKICAEISVTEYPEGFMEGDIECSPNVNRGDARSAISIFLPK